MKICKDCKHSVRKGYGYRCARTRIEYTDKITGEKSVGMRSCSTVRSQEVLGCGSEGKWFEPKESLWKRIADSEWFLDGWFF